MRKNDPRTVFRVGTWIALLAMGGLAACGGRTLMAGDICGDNVVGSSEACDDGNQVDGDGCDALCDLEVDPGCGNGVLETDEECDATAMADTTCSDLGFTSGELACTATCTFDTANCSNAGVCGDGTAEGTEECDATDLGGVTCEDQGYDAGTLACTAGCTFDASGCTSGGLVCGNQVAEGTEACDGADLRGLDCTSFNFDAGTLACQPDCTFDQAGCFNNGPVCGNDVVDAPQEECDGVDMQGQTCQTYGYDGGTLLCSAGCRFDDSQCTFYGCGNGQVDGQWEECDGGDLDGQSCQTMGFPPSPGSSLACNPNCSFDTSGCMAGSATCTSSSSVTCGGTQTGDTAGAPSQVMFWSGQGCGQWPLNGPEVVYTFTAGLTTGPVTVELTGLSGDVDMLVLEDMNGGGCDTSLGCAGVSGSPDSQPETVTFQPVPFGTYYIVIDGFDGATSTYSLGVSCQ